MTFKGHLTPLGDVVLLDDEAQARLRGLNVTTVEELVGLLQSDPDAAGQLLQQDPLQLAQLLQRALDVLPEQVRLALQVEVERDFPFGALDPRDH